jgi:hypothetical protein
MPPDKIFWATTNLSWDFISESYLRVDYQLSYTHTIDINSRKDCLQSLTKVYTRNN